MQNRDTEIISYFLSSLKFLAVLFPPRRPSQRPRLHNGPFFLIRISPFSIPPFPPLGLCSVHIIRHYLLIKLFFPLINFHFFCNVKN